MEFVITSADVAKKVTDCVIVGVYDKKKLAIGAQSVDAATGGLIGGLLEQGDVSGKLGNTMLVSRVDGIRAKRVLIVGLGSASKFGRREYMKALKSALGAVRSTQIKDVHNTLTLETVAGCDAEYLGRLAMQALGERLYRYSETKREGIAPALKLKTMILSAASRGDQKPLRAGAEQGIGVAAGMRLTRELGNTPPNICNPSYLADQARAMAKRHAKLKVRVLGETKMAALGMHSLLSVGNGSEQPSQLIVLDYRGAGDQKPAILVGKGITFDTGGISLKPGPQMDEMKFDMGGAAAVLGTMEAVATMGLPINLTVIVPSAENMPSGRATRPGDVVKSMSGKTIEILNTDAEGRLILCDALTYAQKNYEPAVLIDVATLTGACVIALGRHRSGVMSNDAALAGDLVDAGERAVDRAWHLPLDQEYVDQLKSNFADFANVGGREGGVITAGAFLWQFTKDARWAHIDIAGTAWLSGAKKGATGRPVPLLVDYLLTQID